MASLHNLSLSDDEEELELQPEINSTQIADPNLRLVGRFLTNRPIRTYMMMEKIETFWNPVRGVKIQELEPNLFTFQFYHHLDLQRILRKGPWYFDNHLLILDTIPENTNPNLVALQTVPFWIQVHDLPAGYMSEKVGIDIANSIGQFIEYDAKNGSNYLRQFMKIRVLLDVTKPLKRMKKIKMHGGGTSTIKFKYERLGNYCYYCGMLGHIEDYCEKLYSANSDDGTRIWGPELRVEKQRNHGGGDVNKLRDGGITITAPATVTVTKSNGQNEDSGVSNIPNSGALISLLRNPNLLRKSKLDNAAAANSNAHTNDDQLMEENNEVFIANKTKRSREVISENRHIQSSSVVTGKNTHHAQSSSTPSNKAVTISTSMHVPQTNHFLSAEPGIQACREQ